MPDNWQRRYPGITMVPSYEHLRSLGRRCQTCGAFVRYLSERHWCDDCEDKNLVENFREQLGIGLDPDEPMDGHPSV